ncbi:MAG: Wzt carbohydrate-binding domain-containing protein [Dissulfuribacterales bacterium]
MKLFFDHVPKTAGSSMQLFLAEAFGTERVTPTLRSLKPVTVLSLYKDRKVIIGHFYFLPGESLPSGYVSATILRNPIYRTLSDYQYQCADVSEYSLSSVELKCKSLPIETAFFDPEICERFANYQAVHFASFFHATPQNLPEEELLRLAKKGLDQYDLVGTTERLTEFCEELRRIFDLPKDVMLKRVNVTSTRKKFSDLSPELQRRIEEINRVDMELWRYADSLFETKTRRFQLADKQVAAVSDNNAVSASDEFCEMMPVNIEDGSLELLEVSVNSRMRPGQGLLAGEEAVLSIAFRCHRDIDDLTIGYSIHHDSGLNLFGVNTRLMGYNLQCKAGNDYRVDFSFTANLGLGSYRVNVSAHSGLTHLERCYFWKERVAEFAVDGFVDIQFEGLVRLMPVCHIGDGLEALNIVDQTTGVKRIGFDTPPLEEIAGSIRVLAEIPPVRPGEQFAVMLEIGNHGTKDWMCEGTMPVNIAYHWLDMKGNVVIFDGARTPLPGRILKAGDTVRASALVDAPKQEGRFILELTLVQELVCWFEERGFETARLEVEVVR